MCAERGLDTYLRILLRQGADPGSCTARTRSSALLLAAEAGQPHVLQVSFEEIVSRDVYDFNG